MFITFWANTSTLTGTYAEVVSQGSSGQRDTLYWI